MGEDIRHLRAHFTHKRNDKNLQAAELIVISVNTEREQKETRNISAVSKL